MNDIFSEVIIIGGGPAGLTAALFTSREGLNSLLLEKNLAGGLPTLTDIIENYPGFPDGIKGEKLVERFKQQALKFGAKIVEFEEVKKLERVEKKIIKVVTNKQEYSSPAVIVASGGLPKKLNIPGEEEYTGRGVSYCALCDGPLYKNKSVLVIGGGNAALEEALFLAKFAREVILVYRRPELRGTKIFQERIKRERKIKLLLNHLVVSINGQNFVESVTVKNQESNRESKIDVSGIFIYIGFLPNSKFLEGLVELDNSGFILTNERMETSILGLYAVGDVRAKTVRQVAVACGEGVIAALSARDYLRKI